MLSFRFVRCAEAQTPNYGAVLMQCFPSSRGMRYIRPFLAPAALIKSTVTPRNISFLPANNIIFCPYLPEITLFFFRQIIADKEKIV